MLETKFKRELCNDIQRMLPGCIITHFDPNEMQGLPDLLILWRDKWAALEGKRTATAKVQPNQEYYVELMNDMSFARIVYPENKGAVLRELQDAFQSYR